MAKTKSSKTDQLISAARSVCNLLESAYARGEENEHMDWDDVDQAHQALLELRKLEDKLKKKL